MKLFGRIIWLAILCGSFEALGLPIASAKGLDSKNSKNDGHGVHSWVAFGDLRGYLEPCGCDPKTDMGGIRRISAYLQRERALDRGTLVFSLGNNFSPLRDGSLVTANLKAPFFEEAIIELRPTATLANVTELSWALGNPAGKFEKTHLIQVLSNLKPNFDKRQLSVPFVVSGNAVILGYTWDRSVEELVEPFSSAMAKRWQKEMDGKVSKKNRRAVLLFSGSDRELNQIRKSKIFDIIISSNRSSMAIEPGAEERADPSKLVRSSGVLMVPLGGQGLLLGGAARLNEAKPLAEIFKSASSPLGQPNVQTVQPIHSIPEALTTKATAIPSAAQIDRITGPSFVSWLDSLQDGAGHFDGLFTRYREVTGAQFDARSKQRVADLAVSPFAGAEACKTCHATAYDVWKQSKHASAYKTLQMKSAHTDMECVSCHVVGAKDFGGFVSLDASPGFAGVQCENCHGPRKEHTLNPSIKPHSNSKAACVSCHKTPHSSTFNFEDYWLKIRHGK